MDENDSNTPRKRGCGFWMLVGGAVLLGLLVIGSIFGPSEEEMEIIRADREAEEARAAEQDAAAAAEAAQAQVDQAFAVTAGQLWQMYQDNEVAARSTIGDRPVLVSGTIAAIELDFMDEPVIRLETQNQFERVSLDFDTPDAPAITGLQRGQGLRALCGDVTEVAGTPMLDDCTLVD